MKIGEVVEEYTGPEVVDGADTVEVRRQIVRLPADGASPPIGLERTVAIGARKGPPVLLIHGFAQNRFTWRISGRSLVAALAREGHEVLNVDLRGHGLSRRFGAGNARRFEDYVHDVTRVVKDLDQAPFAVGHSLGGGVVVGLATEVPLRGVVAIAGVYVFATRNPALRALAALTQRFEPLLRAAPVRTNTAWTGDLLGRLYGLTDVLGYGMPIAGWAPGSVERELLTERLAVGFDWTSVEVWLEMAAWAQGRPFPYAKAFEAVDRPLYLMVGDNDPLVTPADAQACFDASRSADKRLEVFEPFHHGGHWGHIDLILGRRAPEVVWPRLLAWMAAR